LLSSSSSGALGVLMKLKGIKKQMDGSLTAWFGTNILSNH